MTGGDIGGEEDDGIGDIARLAEFPQGIPLFCLFELLGGHSEDWSDQTELADFIGAIRDSESGAYHI